MSNRVIDKSDLAGFLDDLLEAHQVLAPVKRDGLLDFEPLHSGEEAVLLDFHNSKRLPKEAFFPRSETLFEFSEGEITAVPIPEEERVVFGIRPCDAKSLVLLDTVFDAPDCQDPYYLGPRERTILIGLGCDRPQSTCFCTAVGGGPFASDGLDVLLVDLADRYLVESVTERGDALLSGSLRFREVSQADIDLKAEVVNRAAQAVSGPDLAGVKERLDVMYDDPFWDELHQKCLGCGVCTYLCPTCHCFDIVDEATGSRGRRVRNWDTCQFSLFTLHTSGHNPRTSGKERMRQRVMHKFSYFVATSGEVGCVGCARCVRECPVNMDIRAVIEAIGRVEG